jgi:hypothetical protein
VIHRWGYGDEYYDQFVGQFVDQKDTLLAHAIDLHIELHAVIFADGTLVGADDRSALTDLFSWYVRAKQDWYGSIEALDADQSVSESFAPIEQFLADATNRMRAGKQLVREKPAEHLRLRCRRPASAIYSEISPRNAEVAKLADAPA